MSRTEIFNKWLEENYGELRKFPLQKLTVDTENGDVENYDKIRIIGNAECWDGDEFYQYMVTDDKIYKVYYNVQPDQELDMIDYTKAYKSVNITEDILYFFED
jgi:hypothetical protein